jgi:hypothetical protein
MDALSVGNALGAIAEGVGYDPSQLVVRIQPFTQGGYEGVCYWRSRDENRNNPFMLTGRAGTRKTDKAEKDRENARRAKRMVRCKAREMVVNNLVTMTTRETAAGGYSTSAHLMDRFAEFVRQYHRATGRSLLYVAVPERHPSNPDHWHLHVAIAGRVDLRVGNAIWWKLCGGRGMGNIDVKKKRGRTDLVRSEKIARYISKYITKNLEEGNELVGRHRYRASRVSLLPRHKFLLNSRDLVEGYNELLGRLNVFVSDVGVFFFPDGTGFYFHAHGDFAVSEPPF